MKWIIKDWAGHYVYKDDAYRHLWEFDSFEDARDFIDEYADRVAKSEEERNGICEDFYAVKKSELLTGAA